MPEGLLKACPKWAMLCNRQLYTRWTPAANGIYYKPYVRGEIFYAPAQPYGALRGYKSWTQKRHDCRRWYVKHRIRQPTNQSGQRGSTEDRNHVWLKNELGIQFSARCVNRECDEHLCHREICQTRGPPKMANYTFRWYVYSSEKDTVEPAANIPYHFRKSYWRTLRKSP